MNEVAIGIQVYEQPGQFRATMESIQRNTTQTVEMILLPDGPDLYIKQELSAYSGLEQSATSQPLGAAACFNRLARISQAEVLVFLESGCVVGPGWLEHLLEALKGNPANGLAGPSTNRSWNEQGAFPRARGSLVEVAQTAHEAHNRFGSDWQILEPLYSLADFCYVVRKEVVEAIGAADERYGLGPCWEMDYNIRAARAGFQGVWAKAAYVYRSAATARRRVEESQRFSTSKRLYQDKFCGLHLRGQRAEYENHCRGSACEHFAPPDLVALRLPLSETTPAEAHPVVNPPVEVAAGMGQPLISCIMPTGGRPDFVLQSISYLKRQDEANWELIIIDGGSDVLQSRIPRDERIRYEQVPAGLSIGAKRNRGCELARGEIIAQWDDDDWYGPQRLSAQVKPILARQADFTALNETIFFDLESWQFWRVTPQLHRRLFVEDVHGGTLVFRRKVWQNLGRYPDRSLAEDALFLRTALLRGARLVRLPGDGHFIYLRHGHNSWAFQCGQYLDSAGWQRIPEPRFPAGDRAFFLERSAAGRVPNRSLAISSFTAAAPAVSRADKVGDNMPLVSCIMPTANRRPLAPLAIHYFLQQDYPNRELVIVDDGEDPITDLIPEDPRIRYLHLHTRRTVGAKRNLACQQAAGSIIVHWDDDDWMAPRRLRYQVEQMEKHGSDVCGLARILYYDPARRRAWEYIYAGRGKPWVGGNTLCYSKALWDRNPFPEINVGEDSRFLWAQGVRKVLVLDDPTFFVGLIHPKNVSPKYTGGVYWQECTEERIREVMGSDWGLYVKIGESIR